jgi:hypothetical protein
VVGMNLLKKIFVSLAITCCAAWLVKQVAILLTGGGDTESPVVGVLWGLGMITFLLAAAVGTAMLLRSVPAWVRVVAAIAMIPVAFWGIELVDVLTEAVAQSDGWFVQEVPLVLAALVMGALGLRTLSSIRHA